MTVVSSDTAVTKFLEELVSRVLKIHKVWKCDFRPKSPFISETV